MDSRVQCSIYSTILPLVSWTCRDFEDVSCEMVYGQVPPPFEELCACRYQCKPQLHYLSQVTTMSNAAILIHFIKAVQTETFLPRKKRQFRHLGSSSACNYAFRHLQN